MRCTGCVLCGAREEGQGKRRGARANTCGLPASASTSQALARRGTDRQPVGMGSARSHAPLKHISARTCR